MMDENYKIITITQSPQLEADNAARILSSCRQLVIAQKYSQNTQNKKSTSELCDFFMLNISKAIKLIT